MEEANKDGATSSPTFAIELAYIIEHYGDESESDAREVLDLYMNAAQSLVLAVSFAQRNQTYSSVLWSALIDHCLVNDKEANNSQEQLDGSLFGLLLEAAALSGADLANLGGTRVLRDRRHRLDFPSEAAVRLDEPRRMTARLVALRQAQGDAVSSVPLASA